MSGSWSNTSTELVIIQAGGTFTGLFVYSPTIGAGNLIASIAAQAGTDPYGNSYVAGLAEYDPVGGVFAALSGGGALFGEIVAGVPDTADASTVGQDVGLGLKLQSFVVPGSSAANDRAVIELLPGGQNQPTGSGQAPVTVFRDSAGNSAHDAWITGALVKSDQLNGQAAEVWQDPTFNTNWTSSTSFGSDTGVQPLQFRRDAQDNLVIEGCFASGGTAPTNSNVFDLPAGFIPTANQPIPVQQRTSGGVLTTGFFFVTAPGSGTPGFRLRAATGFSLAANSQYLVNGSVPLGNIP